MAVAMFAAFALVAAATCPAANVLLVTDGGSLNAEESSRKSAFEGWGHTVTTIQDSSTQAAFDAALASVDMVYVPCTVQDSEVSYKLRTTTCGVVNENVYLEDEFGFATGGGAVLSGHTVQGVDNSHGVTNGLVVGNNKVANGTRDLTYNSYTPGAGVQELGTLNSGSMSIGAIDVGGALANTYSGNSTASGRRVRLPWGNGTWDNLNSTGLLLSQNAVSWASGTGGPRLLLHLELDESSGTTAVDSSDEGNDGTYVYSPELGVVGKRSTAVGFQADSAHDRVSLPIAPIDGSQQVSVAWWMKTSKTGEQAILSGAHSSYSAANAFLLFFYNHTTFRPYMDGTNRSLTVESIADGRWHHCVFTHDRSTGDSELFIDGESAGTLSFPARSGTYELASNGLVIAEEQDSPGGGFAASQAFEGFLDDFRIYNYILTESEIIDLYGLIGHWTFDEGAGSTVADSSPTGNDASFGAGAPQWMTGVHGNAMYFDGSSDVVTGMNVDPPETGTVSFWFYSTGPPGGRQSPWGVGADFEMWQDPDGLVSCDVSTDGEQGGFITSTPLYDAGRWYHLAAVYDSADDSYQIYLDGQLHKSGISTMDIKGQAADLLTFGTSTGSTQYFTGGIDDFRLYSYKLSQEDLAELSGLVGHWRLDDLSGATATDSSLSANDGTYIDGPTLGVLSPREYGAQITNTTQQMMVPASTALNNLGVDGGSFSVALWVKPSEPDGHDRPLLHKGDTAQERTPNLTLNYGDNRVEFAVSAQGNWNAGSTSDSELPTDVWSHIVLVKEGREYRLYIDGKLDKTRVVSGDSYGNNGALYLGANPSRAGDPCSLDDLRIYNYAISEQQIAEIYGLVAQWELNESTGDTAYDSSGLGNDAVLTGTQGWTEGKLEGASELDYSDGEDSYAAPSTRVLSDVNEGSYSVTAWYKPLSVPSGSGSDNYAYQAIVVKPGWHIGIYYNNSQGFECTNYLDGYQWTGGGTWSNTYAPGAFHHVAQVVNLTAGTVELYVDGELKDTDSFTPGSVGQDYGSNPWQIGIADPAASDWRWPAHGVVDDARIYNRALTPEQVEQIYSSGSTTGVRIIKWTMERVRPRDAHPRLPYPLTTMSNSKKHILLIEEDPVLADITGFRLELLGHTVAVLSSAEEALGWLADQLPDLVIIGHFLPGMDGIDLLNRISNDVRTSDIPTMLLSPNSELDDVQRAFNAGNERGMLGQILVRRGLITFEQLGQALSEQYGVPYVEVVPQAVNPQVARLVPEPMARQHACVPLSVSGHRMQLAMAAPDDMEVIAEAELITGYHVDPVVTLEGPLQAALDRSFDDRIVARQTIVDMKMADLEAAEHVEVDEAEAEVDKEDLAPVVRLVRAILMGAINAGTSDIHLEPHQPEMRVRYRVDGELQQVMTIPNHIEEAVVARIKVMADMDTTESRRPQDGRLSVHEAGARVNFRVSSIPTVGGEKVVMRLLDEGNKVFDIKALGLAQRDLSTLQSLIDKPHGMLVVTGPTGSGKTTTMYALLAQLNSINRNIVTVEDPVEYRLTGINQVASDNDYGLGFANALKYIMRQDPDVIMVGEIRDHETATTGVQAALTGHLLISTLHTNDAVGAVARLNDLGIDNFKIGGALLGSVAQRLLRTICPECKEPVEPNPALLKSLTKNYPLPANAVFYRGRGCKKCLGTGYLGRNPIYEIMVVTPELSDGIEKGLPVTKLREIAVSQGMVELVKAGLEQVLAGKTTLEEVHYKISS
ncbi:Type IV pilus assembly ATPase PilB [Durusdinium trenchii]|uniref:Type IV pilus assembly ATPase PilB n=1 Tax=Durusdinium trenchii TaxID=1381693 RepID=A0ABP0LEC7_9DINO